MTETLPITALPEWREYGADEWADAVVAAMKLGGVDHFFFVSGSELTFYQEAIARARQRGWPAPRLVTITHEGVALNAALGSAMVSGQPAATAAHVDVGTFNYGAALHTAWRGGYPVLITAGAGPRAFPGSMPGARESGVQWVQEPRDQGEIVRQFTKMDHRMEHQDNPGLMVSRLLQVAMSEPKGPVYLTVPQETARLPMPGSTRFPTRDQLGVARPTWPDPADAKRVAEWLVRAENPAIYTGQSGRNPDTVAAVQRLAELLAIPVMDTTRVNRLNFPTTHPFSGTGPTPRNADVLVILEAPVPFVGPKNAPRPDAKIAWVDADPVQSRYKTMEFRADLWIPASVAAFCNAVHDAAIRVMGQIDHDKATVRRNKMQERKRAIAEEEERKAMAVASRTPIHPRWVAHELGAVLERDALLLDDSVGAQEFVRSYHRRELPGTYFKSGGSSGGWGVGAAIGAKLAAPDRDVALVSGDGYFMFGSPLPALWAASHHKAAFLSVVLVNRSYSTGTTALRNAYPEGIAATTEDYEGGLFDPPPNFAKLAEAANCSGEVVEDPAQVRPALERGLRHVRDGTPAVVAVMLPTLVEEMRNR